MKKKRKRGNGKKHSIPHNTSVNDMGELVAGMGTVELGEDRREKNSLLQWICHRSCQS